MYLLCFLGTHGEGRNNTKSRNRHTQGYGAHKNMRDICVQAILECMSEEYFCWPDDEGRNKIPLNME